MTLACLLAVVSVGVGGKCFILRKRVGLLNKSLGNLPVDSAVFLGVYVYLFTFILTIMIVRSRPRHSSIPSHPHKCMVVCRFLAWQPCALSVIHPLVSPSSNCSHFQLAWPLIANYSCPEDALACDRTDNMGWRYLLFALGGLTLLFWALRFFCFDLLESPRFLMSVGKDAEAVSIIHKIAKYNGTTTTLTVEHLTEAAEKVVNLGIPVVPRTAVFGLQHVKGLFRTTKMAISTTLLIALWGKWSVVLVDEDSVFIAIIGLAYDLYNCFLPYLYILSLLRYKLLFLTDFSLTTRGVDFGDGSLYITYRNVNRVFATRLLQY